MDYWVFNLNCNLFCTHVYLETLNQLVRSNPTNIYFSLQAALRWIPVASKLGWQTLICTKTVLHWPEYLVHQNVGDRAAWWGKGENPDHVPGIQPGENSQQQHQRLASAWRSLQVNKVFIPLQDFNLFLLWNSSMKKACHFVWRDTHH